MAVKVKTKRKTAYGWLIGITAVLLGVLGVVRTAATPRPVTVQTVTVHPTTVTETVVCSGTVQAAEGIEVTSAVPCVIKSVAVQVGEAVHQGDVLLTVDRAATLSRAVGAGLSETQSEMVSASLPETIVAPRDGVVSAVHAVAGDMVSKDSPCVVLSESGDVHIAVTFRESVLPRVCEGQVVRVSGVAFDKKSYDGVLTHIASSARSRVGGTSTETVIDGVVAIDAAQIDSSLLVGLTAKATIEVATREQVLVVPYESVCTDEQGQSVVYAVEEGVAFRCPVTLGKELPSGVEITDGIVPEQTLVRDASALSGETVVEVTV